ncbi:hypothetical protein ACWF0M_33590 [Kribbella sp. NPDC055110]
MTAIGDGPTEVWTAELRRSGQVSFPLRRRPMLRQGVSGPFFLLFLIGTELPNALKSGGVWPTVTVLLMTACLVGGGFGIWQLVALRPVLTVDGSGIRLGRRRFLAWSDIDTIAELTGPPGDRYFAIVPNAPKRKLQLGDDHVRNVPAFRYWLSDLLADHRRTASSPDRT